MGKIQDSIDFIRKYAPLADKYGGYTVAFSGGKDSQVLLDLFKKSGVKFKAVYNVTTNDQPENVYFIREKYPDVEFKFPKRTFLQLIEYKKCLPHPKRRFCCEYLKEYYGKGICAVGVRREESSKRAEYQTIVFAKKGERRAYSVGGGRKVVVKFCFTLFLNGLNKRFGNTLMKTTYQSTLAMKTAVA